MIKRKTVIILLFLVVFVVIMMVVYWYKYNDNPNFVKNILQNNRLIITDNRQSKYSDYKERFIVASNSRGDTVKFVIVPDISFEGFEKYKNRQFALFNGMFEESLPPYPEFVTNELACPDEFLPKRKSSIFGEYYVVGAGERFNYGVCSADLIKYTSIMGVFYCEKDNIAFKVEYFIDKKNNDSTIDSIVKNFSC